MRKLGILATALALVATIVLAEPVAARSQLTMSPGSSDHIRIQAGASQAGHFTIFNTGTTTLDVRVSPTELCVNESYHFTFEGCTVASSTTMRHWITTSVERATLAPGEETRVNYTINVPPTGLPGGSQHAGVTVTFTGEGEDGVSAEYRLGYRMFAYNPIGARVDSELVSARIDRLQFKRPISARSTVRNNGNVDFFTKTTMTISTLPGREVNREERNHVVMPETTRAIESSWEGSPHLGIFRVRYEIVLESIDGQLLEARTVERFVLIMPLFLFVVILVVLAALLVFLVMRVKKTSELKSARRF